MATPAPVIVNAAPNTRRRTTVSAKAYRAAEQAFAGQHMLPPQIA